jgi:two-component system chemotaxis response regulator CheB
MSKTRVLIVDDSLVVRRLLTAILAAEPDMEVVAAVGNAELALKKIEECAPDVVTLDVEMPDMNGLDLLEEIRKRAPQLPVIMFSALTQRAAATTLEALARGATDYVAKPAGTGSREAAAEHVRTELGTKIRVLMGRQKRVRRNSVPEPNQPAPPVRTSSGPIQLAPVNMGAIDVLAVGCSTGGPNALAQVFAGIPKNFPVPVVIVQHMPPVFTRMLAERLTATCSLDFREGADGDVLVPGRAYIAPGDFHMRVVRQGARVTVALDKGPPENFCRPAVDVLFRSVAEVFSSRTLGVILTGMGQDGLIGCEKLHAAGAQIVTQDEASSVVWGMPGFVTRAGLSNAVLPIGEIAAEIVRRAAVRPRAQARAGGTDHVQR